MQIHIRIIYPSLLVLFMGLHFSSNAIACGGPGSPPCAPDISITIPDTVAPLPDFPPNTFNTLQDKKSGEIKGNATGVGVFSDGEIKGNAFNTLQDKKSGEIKGNATGVGVFSDGEIKGNAFNTLQDKKSGEIKGNATGVGVFSDGGK